MKKTLLILATVFVFRSGYAQHISLETGGGTGLVYIMENTDKGINTKYSYPTAIHFGVKINPLESNIYFRTRLQYINAGLSGENWKNGITLNGDVSSLGLYEAIEYLFPFTISDSKWEIGPSIGLGFVYESVNQNKTYYMQPIINVYFACYAGASIGVNIDSKFKIFLEPTFYVTDPVNALRYYFITPSKLNLAGEDIHFLVQIGFSYQLR